jgi:uncharacterized protein with FMN-binding domain
MNNQNPTGNSNRLIISIIVVVVVIAGVLWMVSAGGRFSSSNQQNSGDNLINEETSGDEVSPTDDTDDFGELESIDDGDDGDEAVSKYKDGTYTSAGAYKSPAGPESVEVTLVIRNDIIMDATVVGKAKNDISIKMQNAFIEGYKTLVIGKNIDSIKVDKVSGSSLTPKGFNAAVELIKTQA